MYAFADTKVGKGDAAGCNRFSYKLRQDKEDIGNPDARHGKTLNMTFVDGHCENIKIDNPADPYYTLGEGWDQLRWTGWDSTQDNSRF